MRSQRSPCGKRYYRCGNRIVDKPCEHRMIPASVAEAEVAAMISRIVHIDNWRTCIEGTGITDVQIDRRAKELKQTVERLDLQWDQGFIAKDQYLARRIELQKQLEQLRPFTESELKEAEELLDKFEKSWSVDDTIEYKRLFNRVVEKVWIRERRVTALRLRPLFAYLAQHVSGINVDGEGVIVSHEG
jgi:Recombinase zinc beta ribbon domain